MYVCILIFRGKDDFCDVSSNHCMYVCVYVYVCIQGSQTMKICSCIKTNPRRQTDLVRSRRIYGSMMRRRGKGMYVCPYKCMYPTSDYRIRVFIYLHFDVHVAYHIHLLYVSDSVATHRVRQHLGYGNHSFFPM